MKKPIPRTNRPLEDVETEQVTVNDAVNDADTPPAPFGAEVLPEASTEVPANDPLPSFPVNDTPVPPPTRVGVQYLGTIGTQGASGPGARAALPVAIFREADDSLLGVAVVSDPGCLSTALPARLPSLLEQHQIVAPLVTLKTAPALSRSQREVIARIIAIQKDPTLDHDGALAALGFTLSSLGL